MAVFNVVPIVKKRERENIVVDLAAKGKSFDCDFNHFRRKRSLNRNVNERLSKPERKKPRSMFSFVDGLGVLCFSLVDIIFTY